MSFNADKELIKQLTTYDVNLLSQIILPNGDTLFHSIADKS